MPITSTQPLSIRDEKSLTKKELDDLGNQSTLRNFAHYAKYSTPKTELFFTKIYSGSEFLGLAPVTKLVKHKSTDLLRPAQRKWMGLLLGFLSRKTTYMVDSGFLAFEYKNPFFCPDSKNEEIVRTAVSNHLKNKGDVDTVLLAEPERDTSWAEQHGYDCFSILPMVDVELCNHTTIESYIGALSRKRRKNWRADRKTFDDNGGVVALYEFPIPHAVLEQMHNCLMKSASFNDWCVPYEDVQNSKSAFFGQKQSALVSMVNGKVTGFFSFFKNNNLIQQCHGGFNHQESLSVKAYANLINSAIEHAIRHGFDRLTMGPLNNETKRRAGSHLMPMMASLWCRDTIGRFVIRKFFLKNFQIYIGEVNGKMSQRLDND